MERALVEREVRREAAGDIRTTGLVTHTHTHRLTATSKVRRGGIYTLIQYGKGMWRTVAFLRKPCEEVR